MFFMEFFHNFAILSPLKLFDRIDSKINGRVPCKRDA